MKVEKKKQKKKGGVRKPVLKFVRLFCFCFLLLLLWRIKVTKQMGVGQGL